MEVGVEAVKADPQAMDFLRHNQHGLVLDTQGGAKARRPSGKVRRQLLMQPNNFAGVRVFKASPE